MGAKQRIVRERRQYNQLAANQTLEDFALRYTAERARTWSAWRVANTAIGAISFLACEAIGAAITLSYGFTNAVAAIVAVGLLSILVGLPITYHATRAGVDVDLLTRGAGFGYLGSTITSLVYASFTFILFAIEASIMSAGLELLLGIPLPIAHVISALTVIPIALYGMRFISRMQILTQPVWLVLQCVPFAYVALLDRSIVGDWLAFTGTQGNPDGSLGLLPFGMAASVLLSLLPQIGEQVDYLRFLPDRSRIRRGTWWAAMLIGGPGWVLLGSAKLLIGSLLGYLAIRHGLPTANATQPTDLYHFAFLDLFRNPAVALGLAAVFVIVCQLKINVTNAYAGSLAWSNFFSRLTHSHPGRVVWLVFNVLLALMLMEVGVLGVIESVLALYANVAVGWLGAVAADLTINKPLGYSPRHIEFKRAYLYDINPVGVGAMALSVLASTIAFFGTFGSIAQALSPFIGLVVAYAAAPAIAWATKGRYYLARPADELGPAAEVRCSICENVFERRDMAYCPAYAAPICSLCCTLDARCHDCCKTGSRFADQIAVWLQKVLPARLAAGVQGRTSHFLGVMLLFTLVIGGLLTAIDFHFTTMPAAERGAVRGALLGVFFSLFILSGIAAWLLVLAQESRRKAEEETARQTGMLMEEIAAHERTDAALQQAKEAAESANAAKSRYIIGLSHEIRAPLNAISGYAQLMEHGAAERPEDAVKVIRRSADHLSNLIDGLLDISKIESGVRKLNREKVQLIDFLDQLVDMFRVQASAKGLDFRYARTGYLPAYVNTDAKILRQILINLLSNAVKYTETGHVAFSVRYRSQIAEFEIADTGMGIPAEDLERVFEAFERGRGAAARVSGTGLGLTFTRLLTRIMGGDITVKSEPGAGSAFRVRLLLSEAVHTGDEEVARRAITGYAGPRITVLMADDNPDHLGLMSDILKPLGFVLHAASDGAGCLELADRVRPDLVILDISMPGESGWDIAAAIRDRFGDAVRILMVSANAYEQQGPAGASTGPHDAFIAKPVELGALLDQVQALTGLEWVQEAKRPVGRPAAGRNGAAVPPATGAGIAHEPASGAVPPGALRHIDDLRQLGRIGYVRGIEAKLTEMEAEDAANAAFAGRLRTMVRAFNLKGYMKLLEEAREAAE